MKECPDCNTEYNAEGKCPNCGTARDEQLKKDGWIELTTVANEIEFTMVSKLMEMADIPVVKETRGIDGFLEIVIGVPIAGIKVMVPEDRYEEAVQLLEAQVDENELAEEAEEAQKDSD